MLDAVSGHPARADLASIGHEPEQQRRVLVIDVRLVVLTEAAGSGGDLRRALGSTRLSHCPSPSPGSSDLFRVRGPKPPHPVAAATGACGLERRILRPAAAEGTGLRGAAPRIGSTGLPAATEAAATAGGGLAPTAAERAATAAASAAGLGDVRRGELQGGTDLVDVQLDHGALLALTGLEAALLEPSLHDHPHAAGERFGDVLRGLTPDAAAQEQRFAVHPLTALTVEPARSAGHRERR